MIEEEKIYTLHVLDRIVSFDSRDGRFRSKIEVDRSEIPLSWGRGREGDVNLQGEIIYRSPGLV